MKSLTRDIILAGTKNAQENTWGNKLTDVIPSIDKSDECIIYKTIDERVEIDSVDEIPLTVIAKFTFCPYWLIEDFYKNSGLEDESVSQKIDKWVRVGLVWKESAVTGLYIRPTYALFNLFGIECKEYEGIPFNLLTHTIAEEKVVFDIMSGSSDILLKETVLDRVSELGFDVTSGGTNAILECDFKMPKLYTKEGVQELMETDKAIDEAMKNGDIVSPELMDFSQFVEFKRIDNTGVIKNDYKYHFPDIIIPMTRDNGKPRSIAVEVELSNKRVKGYEESLKRYKNSKKFGVVYWLCSSGITSNSIRAAFSKVGGCGSCRIVLLEFIIPTPNYDF